jgi:predicted TIM-barrel fold metal-dependent hydrolase
MVIDSHTHIFPSFIRENKVLYQEKDPGFGLLYSSSDARMVGADQLIENMDRENVDMSVVFGFPWRDEELYRRHNDYIIESAAKRPDRLIGRCCFDPMSENAAKETERCLEAGLKGVGELAVYDRPITGDVIDALEDVMTLLKDHGVPVLIHTNEQVGHSYSGKQDIALGQIYQLIKRYPENRIILAHWGGGLFFYMLMKREVRKVLDNVWFDTAASPYLYSPAIYKVAGDIMGFDRILFGSDYPLLGPERYIREMQDAGLNNSVIKKISGKNSADLFEV